MKAYRTLLTVCHNECHYIIGEPNGFETLYCGDPVVGVGKSYCAQHAERMFVGKALSAAEINDLLKELERNDAPVEYNDDLESLDEWLTDLMQRPTKSPK